MRVGELFAGIGGLGLGLEPAPAGVGSEPMTQIQALYAVVAAGRGEDRERLRAVTADRREGRQLLMSARTLWPQAQLVVFAREPVLR